MGTIQKNWALIEIPREWKSRNKICTIQPTKCSRKTTWTASVSYTSPSNERVYDLLLSLFFVSRILIYRLLDRDQLNNNWNKIENRVVSSEQWQFSSRDYRPETTIENRSGFSDRELALLTIESAEKAVKNGKKRRNLFQRNKRTFWSFFCFRDEKKLTLIKWPCRIVYRFWDARTKSSSALITCSVD